VLVASDDVKDHVRLRTKLSSTPFQSTVGVSALGLEKSVVRFADQTMLEVW